MRAGLLIAGLVAAVVVVVLVVSGGEKEPEPTPLKDRVARERAAVKREVRAGRLPEVALEMFDENGIRANFAGDEGDDDVLYVGDRKLRFDLDQSGRIEASEREITERELYTVVLRMLKRPPPEPGNDPGESS
jgi:hypothetical protein